MSQIRPFQAIRPVKNKSCLVPSYAVETYSHTEINRILRNNPYSFLNVIAKPYIKNLPADKRHQAIRKRVKKFLNNNILTRDTIPSLYVMRITAKTGEQFTGLVGLASADEYLEGKIKKHEDVLDKRAGLFADYLYNVKMNAEPVLLAHKPSAEVDQLIDRIQTEIPVYEFSMTDGTVFEVWTVARHEQIHAIQEAFASFDALYIADGHHRVESSARLKKRMQAENPYHTGLEFYNFFMAFFLPWDQLKIYGYNRGIRQLDASLPDILKKLKAHFTVRPMENFSPPEQDEVVLMHSRDFYSIRIPQSFFQRGWSVPETVNNVIFKEIIPVGKLSDLIYCSAKNSRVCIAKRLKSGECKLALFLPPVPFSVIKRKADAGQTLPPKSTYIEPKLLSGLFIFEF